MIQLCDFLITRRINVLTQLGAMLQNLVLVPVQVFNILEIILVHHKVAIFHERINEMLKNWILKFNINRYVRVYKTTFLHSKNYYIIQEFSMGKILELNDQYTTRIFFKLQALQKIQGYESIGVSYKNY